MKLEIASCEKFPVRPLLTSMLMIGIASPSQAGLTFATFTDSNTGSVDGVGFTMSGLSSPAFGADIQTLSMAGADWNSVGAQQGRIYNANTTTTFTVTFDSPISGLEMYPYYFRGGATGGGGYDSYDFGQAFTSTGGPLSQSGTTIDTSSVTFASGVISFTGPVSTLTVSTTGGPANGGDQGFTFARSSEAGVSAIPEPSPHLTLLALGVGGLTIRRRLKHKDA